MQNINNRGNGGGGALNAQLFVNLKLLFKKSIKSVFF